MARKSTAEIEGNDTPPAEEKSLEWRIQRLEHAAGFRELHPDTEPPEKSDSG